MKVAFIIKSGQAEVLKSKIESAKGNVHMECFSDIDSFIDMSVKRNSVYDRILLLANVLNISNMNDFYNYWNEYAQNSTVVVVARKGKDEDFANTFMQKFTNPNVTVILTTDTTVRTMVEASSATIGTLNSNYNVEGFLNVSVGGNNIISLANKEQTNSQQKTIQPVVNNTQQMKNKNIKQNVKKQKKGGFLTSIFGSHGNNNQINQNVANTNNTANIEELPEELPEDFSEYTYLPNEMNNYSPNEMDSYSPNEMDSYAPNEMDSYAPNEMDSYSPNEMDSYAPNEMDSYTPNEMNGYTPNEMNNYSPNDVDLSVSDNSQMNSGFIEDTTFDTEDVEDIPDSFFEELNSDQGINQNKSQSINQNNKHSVQQDVAQIDDADTDTDWNLSNLSTDNISRRTQNVDVTDRDIDVGNINIGNAENAYQQAKAKENIRVETKIVKVGGKGILSNVYAGTVHKVVVVTGDRATGVTSTALTLARAYSEHIPILYFDCDIQNHGLLNYIDYGTFNNYEQSHKEGIRAARNKMTFQSCVIGYDDNFDILTSDYSCDATLEDLESATTAVTEVMQDYGVVVVDCPVDNLDAIKDLLLMGSTVLCVEGSHRGFMNMLCRLESSKLATRYRNAMAGKGIMFVTKCSRNTNMNKLVKDISALYEPADADWMAMHKIAFNGKCTNEILNLAVEG